MRAVFSILKTIRISRIVLSMPLLCAAFSLGNPGKALAFNCPLPVTITTEHQNGQQSITQHIADEFNDHRDWLTDTFAEQHVIPALQLFTEQMSAVAMQQTMIIGQFFDAKHQLETQRLFQELQVQAHKDYQPSTNFCTFGTNVRTLAHSESHGRFNAVAIAQRQMARHVGQVNMAGARDANADKVARWNQFVDLFCDPQDNNWQTGITDTGLSTICNSANANTHNSMGAYNGPNSDSINADIDYTRIIETPSTMDISRPLDAGSRQEIYTQALGNNLYGHNIMFRNISRTNILKGDKPKLYMGLRAITAKRSVAENSYNSIVGMKSIGSSAGLLDPGAPFVTQTDQYLGAILTELGVPPAEVMNYVGDDGNDANVDFSYYNQLEILAKKIYQNPDFFANLYDKPANVKRVGAALQAIELMLDRSIYESQLRQEMAMSVLLSSRLRMNYFDINKNLNK